MVKGPWFPGCVLRSKGHPFGFARVWVSVVFWMDPFRSWFFGVKEKSESPLILSFFLCVLVPLCFPTFCAPTTAIILPSFSLGEATLSFAKRTGEKCLAFKQIIQQGWSRFLFFFKIAAAVWHPNIWLPNCGELWQATPFWWWELCILWGRAIMCQPPLVSGNLVVSFRKLDQKKK